MLPFSFLNFKIIYFMLLKDFFKGRKMPNVKNVQNFHFKIKTNINCILNN